LDRLSLLRWRRWRGRWGDGNCRATWTRRHGRSWLRRRLPACGGDHRAANYTHRHCAGARADQEIAACRERFDPLA
jgi:hypothetical protein